MLQIPDELQIAERIVRLSNAKKTHKSWNKWHHDDIRHYLKRFGQGNNHRLAKRVMYELVYFMLTNVQFPRLTLKPSIS